MELYRGKITLPADGRLKFTNGMSTLLCADGMVYVLTDARLQKAAEQIDSLPSVLAAQMARALFGAASSARVSRKGVLKIKDSPAALAALEGKSFELRIPGEGLALLIPDGIDPTGASFFREEIGKDWALR